MLLLFVCRVHRVLGWMQCYTKENEILTCNNLVLTWGYRSSKDRLVNQVLTQEVVIVYIYIYCVIDRAPVHLMLQVVLASEVL